MKGALAALLCLLASPVFAVCPGYVGQAGFASGKTVYVDFSNLNSYWREPAIDAFVAWNIANAYSGANVQFALGSATATHVVVKTGQLPPGVAGRTFPNDGPEIMYALIVIDTSKFPEMVGQQEYFMKIVLHEVGHTLGLGDVVKENAPCGWNAGATVMNQLCGLTNDREGMIPTQPAPCDIDSIKNDPKRKKAPVSQNPDGSCQPRNGIHLCEELEACVWADNEPKHCETSLVCERADVTRSTCSGQSAEVSVSGDPCGAWKHVPNSPERPGDYACADDTSLFAAPACAELGLEADAGGCESACGKPCVHTEVASIGLLCHSCAYQPPPPPPPDPGACVPQGCPDVTVNGCKWKPDGCGGEILCGVCLPPPAPIDDPPPGGGGPPPDPPPVCSGDHNEVCFGSFKACNEVCCGVCERKNGCGSESAHKCFEP